MSYSVDDLFLFSQITQFKSLNDAANELEITPSSLTRFIQKLEADLGSPLIITTRDGFVPSNFGRALKNRFEKYHQLFDMDLTSIHSRYDKYKGVFDIALPLSIADHILPQLLIIAREYDDVSFKIYIQNGFIHDEDPSCLQKIHFALLDINEQNPLNKYLIVQSNFIGKLYNELFATDKYLNKYGVPSDILQLSELHHHKIVATNKYPIYAHERGRKDSILISQSPAIALHGGKIYDLVSSGNYLGIGLSQSLHKEFINLFPDYHFGELSAYLYENKGLTRQYPKKLINLIKDAIFNSANNYELTDGNK